MALNIREDSNENTDVFNLYVCYKENRHVILLYHENRVSTLDPFHLYLQCEVFTVVFGQPSVSCCCQVGLVLLVCPVHFLLELVRILF